MLRFNFTRSSNINKSRHIQLMKEQKKEATNPDSLTKPSSFIGNYQEAPVYMKDNEHITHGYRINFDSPKKIFRSLFMVHNESVNIWTHFVPALILFVFIFYLLVFVGPTNIMHDLSQGREKLSQEINSYAQALNNLSFVMRVKQIKSETGKEFDEVSQSIINSYSKLENGLQHWKSNVETKFSNFHNEVKSSFSHQLNQMETLKEDFERLFVPYIVNGIKDQIDPEYLKVMTEKLQSIKRKLDSEKFSYVEILGKSGPGLQQVSRWPVFMMLFSAVICLLCSTTFHLFYPMSGRSYQVFSRLDYAGINILIVGSSFPAIYYGMYCNFLLAVFYLTIISMMGTSLFIFTLFDYLHRPENLLMKALAYGGFGVSLSVILIHQAINEIVFSNYGDSFSISNAIGYYLLCGFFYLFGLYVYTVRCPERHHPGKYNVCGNSHQIWHCFVVLGIIATYLGSLEALESRKNSICPSMI